MQDKARSSRLGQAGAAGVEFGIVLPLLVILTFGAIEMGRVVWHHEIVTKGVRDGVRYLTRVPVSCPGPGAGSFSPTEITRAENLVKSGDPTGGTPIINAYNSATFTVTVDCRVAADLGLSGGTYLPVVQMNAEVPFEGYFLGIIGLDDVAFNIAHEQAHVGE
ncbi:MAG TPA: TadE family protein [Alphaproteobacteria bacterium]|nr:TadE family protein [Alphaproteobacteria bacterium]